MKRKVNKFRRSQITFEELYIDYLLFIQNINMFQEINYIQKHNKLDILNIDYWIRKTLDEAINE